MDRINGAGTVDIGGGRRGFVDEDLGVGQIGTEVTALWLNMTQEELLKVSEASGFDANAGAWDQLAKAIQSQRLTYAVDHGTADNLAITLPVAPSALTAGMTVRVLKGASQSTIAGATLNVNGLGAVPIKSGSGALLSAGDLAASTLYDFTYDGTAWRIRGQGAKATGLRGLEIIKSSTTYTVPDGVFQVLIEGWGAGGGGGSGSGAAVERAGPISRFLQMSNPATPSRSPWVPQLQRRQSTPPAAPAAPRPSPSME